MSGNLFDGVDTPAIEDSRVEVGAHHDGLCDSLTMDIAEA